MFNDAYAGKPPEQLRSYVTPWVDSGPNQLSMLGAFVSGWRPAAAAHEPMRSVVTLDHDGGTSVLASNWLAGDTSKQTTLEFRGGSVRLRMDHTSMTGLVVEDGRVTAHAGYSGALSRKDAHYTGLYDVLLTEPADHRLSVALAADVARLLEAGTRAGAAGLRWGDVTG
ncbi:hypothetical protein [Nocardioides sp. TF02-7]|uniref:hypothetical protein n=1 Tax=Nocardioides sp. TF02-7 TaxID=2917724 RepID=UPI001F066A04|nr:hypothetical protein [Nocardioides sp. TF02-7]UMG93544.1 hypothetical protein MF408_04930 [Nocardioides sp. TF02-7]